MEQMIEAEARKLCVAANHDPDGNDLSPGSPDWKNWMKFADEAKAIVIAIITG